MNRFEFDARFKIIATVVVVFISFAVLEGGREGAKGKKKKRNAFV